MGRRPSVISSSPPEQSRSRIQVNNDVASLSVAPTQFAAVAAHGSAFNTSAELRSSDGGELQLPGRGLSGSHDEYVADGLSSSIKPKPVTRLIGENRVCCGGLCITGPEHGMALLSLILLLLPSLLLDFVVLPWFFRNGSRSFGLGMTITTVILQIISVVSFFATACSDPGIVPRAADPLATYDAALQQGRMRPPPKHQDVVLNGRLFKLKYCVTCNIYRGPRTVHCGVCDNCVEGFDHHCPWVGNCVGARNYSRFYIFLASTSWLGVMVFCCAIAKIAILGRQLAKASSQGSATSSGSLISDMCSAAWESLLLSVFTFIVLWFVFGLLIYHTYLVSFCGLLRAEAKEIICLYLLPAQIMTAQTTYEQLKNYYDGELNPWDRGFFGNFAFSLCRRPRPRLFDATILDAPQPNALDWHSGESRSPPGAYVCGVEICSVAEGNPSGNRVEDRCGPGDAIGASTASAASAASAEANLVVALRRDTAAGPRTRERFPRNGVSFESASSLPGTEDLSQPLPQNNGPPFSSYQGPTTKLPDTQYSKKRIGDAVPHEAHRKTATAGHYVSNPEECRETPDPPVLDSTPFQREAPGRSPMTAAASHMDLSMFKTPLEYQRNGTFVSRSEFFTPGDLTRKARG